MAKALIKWIIGGLTLALLTLTAYFSLTLTTQPILNGGRQFTMLVSLVVFVLIIARL